MSHRGQVVLALGFLVLLGVWGLWLINVPLWAAATVGAGAALALGWLLGRLRRKNTDRQKTET